MSGSTVHLVDVIWTIRSLILEPRTAKLSGSEIVAWNKRIEHLKSLDKRVEGHSDPEVLREARAKLQDAVVATDRVRCRLFELRRSW